MAFRRTALVLVLALIVAGVVPAYAGGNTTWTATGGPPGATVNALIAPPGVPGALLAGTTGGIYLTRDSGAHWQPSFSGLGDLYISTLASSPDATVIYAGTRNGIYRSKDGGATWTRSDPRISDQLILALIVDPLNSSLAYAASATNLYKTENSGDDWSEVAQALRPAQIWSLAFAPDSKALYAVTDGGIYVTGDRGGKWSKFGDAISEGTRAQTLLVTERGMFTATTQGLYQSKDGKGWSATSGIVSNVLTRPLAADAREPNRMFAATPRGLVKSVDGGRTWTLVPNAPADSQILTILVNPKGQVFVGNGRGVWRTEDDGATWQLASTGLAGSGINALVYAATNPDALIAATRFGIWLSRDRGATWTESQGVTEPNVISLASDPMNARVLYAGTNGGAIFISKDGGATFARVASIGSKSPIASLAIVHPTATGTRIFAGTLGDGVYWSGDDGKTWTAQSGGLGTTPRVTALEAVGPSALLSGTDRGLFRLDIANPSATWTAVAATLPADPVVGIAVGPSQGKAVIVAYGSSGIFKSEDAGATWSAAGQNAFPNLTHLLSLARRADNGTLYVGTDNGVFRSQDGGNTWSAMSDGLRPGAIVQAIAVDPRSGGPIFIGTSAFGVLAGNEVVSGSAMPSSETMVAAAAIVVALAGIALLVSRMRRRPRPLPVKALTVKPIDIAEDSITNALWTFGDANAEHLPSLARDKLPKALLLYQEQHPDDALTLDKSATTLKLDNYAASSEFLHDWQVAREAADDPPAFAAITSEMVDQLCQLLGMARVEERDFRGLIGYVVRAPSLRLKIPSRFPIVFMPPHEVRERDMTILRDLLGLLDLSGYFCLLVDLHDAAETGQKRTLKLMARQSVHDFIVLDREDVQRLYSARDPVRRLVERILSQVDLAVISPYVTSGPVPDNMFFGREHELKTILRTIHSANYAIVGGRKIGKTSVLARVHRLLQESPEFQSLYLDCQALHTDADFFEAVETLWHEAMASRSPEGFRRMIVDLMERNPNRCMVLLFDEIDSLLHNDIAQGERLFHIFRALSQESQVRFVFCGEKQLAAASRDPRLVFFNFCTILPLSYLTPAEAQRIVVEPMQDMGISFEVGAGLAAHIVEESGGHPNILQYICQKLIERINTRHVMIVSRADVQAVLTSAEYAEYVTAVVWGNAGPLEQLITCLMLDRHEATAGEIGGLLRKRKVAVTPEQLQEALEGLCLSCVLGRDGPKYAIANDRFADALRRSQDIDGLWASSAST